MYQDEFVDTTTKPSCTVKKEVFDYAMVSYRLNPNYIFPESEAPPGSLEYSIELYGSNNFCDQLNQLYNKLLNLEENLISGYQGEDFDRQSLIDKARKHLKANEGKVAPWQKYQPDLYKEEVFISQLETRIGLKLPFVSKG